MNLWINKIDPLNCPAIKSYKINYAKQWKGGDFIRYLKIGLLIILIFVSAYLLHYYFVGIKDPYITGYVTDIQDNRAFIISGELDEDTDLFPASWLRIPYLTQITGNPQIGQKVEASVKGIIAQTYPTQANCPYL